MIVVVGAGVVGSWISLKLAERGEDVFLLDKEPALWYHTSTRNSGVLHAGIYYDYHSLKRIFCINGQKQSYDFFKKYNVEHRISGKIIVGMSEKDETILKELKIKGENNGVKGLKLIDKNQIKKLEPFCKAEIALYSPYTGVVNCSDYYKKMEALLQEKNVNVVTNCEVLNIKSNVVETDRGNLEFDFFINSAGLNSDNIASLTGIIDFKIIPYKGEYYALNDEKVNSMIYPVPGEKGHLGIHLTKAAYNEIWIGPTSKEVNNKEDYNVTEKRDIFVKACEVLLENFNENKIVEGFAGVRAKCFKGRKLMKDFHIFRQGNIVHLLGIDSPGLTAAPAIADYVLELI
jgi:L-2-hydroxyglutarate oxidase LhgO